MSQTFGFERPNVYDRIVHFLFGLLDFILSYSAAYEIIEASVAWMLPPAEYDPFVGLQGDMWDGYRDMLCAVSGAVLSMAIVVLLAAKARLLRNRFTNTLNVSPRD